MNVEKIILKDGIIQNKTIMGIPVNIDIVEPYGKKNVRRLIKFSRIPDQCYHNTANKLADAEDHGRWQQTIENQDKLYVSPHIYIDDYAIVQVVPLDECGYHAGTSYGNNSSIGIEICEDGLPSDDKAEFNAQCFGACYMYTFPDTNIYKHQDFSGKYCPRIILDGGRWDSFKKGIADMSTNKENVSDWAQEAWDWAREIGLNDGEGAKNTITEEQLMVFIKRYHDKLTELK